MAARWGRIPHVFEIPCRRISRLTTLKRPNVRAVPPLRPNGGVCRHPWYTLDGEGAARVSIPVGHPPPRSGISNGGCWDHRTETVYTDTIILPAVEKTTGCAKLTYLWKNEYWQRQRRPLEDDAAIQAMFTIAGWRAIGFNPYPMPVDAV